MCIFRKKKPLEYKDIEASVKFMFADEDEVRRIINVMADCIKAGQRMARSFPNIKIER